jgi:GxxExxY protein
MAIKLELDKAPDLMNENELASVVLEVCFQIHRKWGPGLLETVYENLLVHHLRANGFYVEQQKEIPFLEDGVKVAIGFRADVVVQEKIIIELKALERLALVHPKILLTYLRLTDLKLGILINFNEALLKDGIKRVINGYL